MARNVFIISENNKGKQLQKRIFYMIPGKEVNKQYSGIIYENRIRL